MAAAMDHLIATKAVQFQEAMECETEAAEAEQALAALAQIKAERARLAQLLAAHLLQHILPPAALGSKRASLLHKVHALLHGIRMESASWRAVGELLQNVVSVTTDQGVESGIADVHSVDLDAMFPHLTDLTEDPEHLNLVSCDAPALGAAADIHHLMPLAIWVPGALHMLHGAAHELTNGLAHFDEIYYPMLADFTNFFKHQWTRERFVAQCLMPSGLAGVAYIEDFRSYTASLAEWRWGYLIDAIEQARDYEVALANPC